MFHAPHRDEVFVAGGQPSVTYVDRQEFHVERNLARAIATPNQIVSVAGPTKTGKTVLCRKVLGQRDYIWVDGGTVSDTGDLWERICSELNIPYERTNSTETEVGGQIGVDAGFTASGSRLTRTAQIQTHRIQTMSEAIGVLLSEGIILVIDDFHYLPAEQRTLLMRNVKAAVFNGLKVLLLSVTHRAFDAIRAESELTGRFISITLPDWTIEELKQIAVQGFSALKTDYSNQLILRLAEEAQSSPFLMQKFCWEICFDCNIEAASLLQRHTIPSDYNADEMFVRLAKDAGLPIYQKLVAGPQSRKKRTKRPLRTGGEADIYEATLYALAETGPQASVSYEDLRGALGSLLADMMPQKHEITSALKHLVNISMKSGADTAIDWDEDRREVNISDPYLRFYLRWQVRNRNSAETPLLSIKGAAH